jgi:CheY-like chemotaxis protein
MARIIWMDDYAGRGTKARIGFDGLVYFIEAKGHQVEIVSARERMEALLLTCDYDLLILDIIMEPLTTSSQSAHQYGGMDVLEQLRTHQCDVPVIVLSVMAARSIKDEALRRGVDLREVGVREIRRKGSVTPRELADVVEGLLSGSSAGGVS